LGEGGRPAGHRPGRAHLRRVRRARRRHPAVRGRLTRYRARELLKPLTELEHCSNPCPAWPGVVVDMRRSRRITMLSTLLSIGSAAALVAALAGAPPSQAASSAAGPPNVVFVLTDDLSWNLVQYLPQVQKMQSQGMTFN